LDLMKIIQRNTGGLNKMTLHGPDGESFRHIF
jgi:hypothetical protein